MPDTVTKARYVREVPMDFNGYAAIARPAVRVPASDVLMGDVLLLDGCVSRVTAVMVCNFNGDPYWQSTGGAVGSTKALVDEFTEKHMWPVLRFSGDVNVIRFPHELVSVMRAD